MKKTINTLCFLLFGGAIAFSTQSCNSTSSDNSTSEKEVYAENKEFGEVKAYYFHATRRCATCQAVEEVSKEAIKEYYGDKVTFESINRDEDKDNPLMTKYKVNGQTLLIVNGDKKVNLTNDAFLNARTNPKKLKVKLISTINEMM
ncbi:MAG: nitrophenyl compound nitroreductase subunit ArsF family protein [Dysgonamonadaceae bacterium]|nr:nitrophenyl compound nitroreductase subunit ArsF family protein [Dysgonamonadaceae bacterium]MDD4729114.1 nitrophenyl compound nitroreductase subunit ArsF family protein [Dysgonamonadaceae bacterium]